ncbi:type II secretion system protein GspC [Halioglobus japonicus]|uniref:Type II secretion system protein GspC n=1 Tax=Halioglobus japonicus TaxID=930805 RepID=A0AAP8SP03_9GAMM|nr:type II secretion system protein GspC [Halioglobus japonicus]
MYKESSQSLPAQWLTTTNEVSGKLSQTLSPALHQLGQPVNLRRARNLTVVLMVGWLLYSLARIVWALVVPAEEVASVVPVVNPVVQQTRSAGPAEVDIEAMRGWHLFGEAGVEETPVPEVVIAEANVSERDGIEKGARETRLQLKLRGVVASTEDGFGHAIIEHRNKQAVYAIDDKLPVSSRVTLAKVMPHQVVLDNAGTYELLVLFEETELDAQASASAQPRNVRRAAPAAQVDKREDATATELARGYRQRLYQNPQSLAEVVNVAAVRNDGDLQGYRISPGKDKDQFAQLGFKSGDLVTSVNGIALDDPSNTMRLYQTLRTASEAVFELQRGDQQVSLTVSLGEEQAQ